jgi:hypothetical protein
MNDQLVAEVTTYRTQKQNTGGERRFPQRDSKSRFQLWSSVDLRLRPHDLWDRPITGLSEWNRSSECNIL